MEHFWLFPVRYDGSLAEGPPPGQKHVQAVVYECGRCHVIRVEPMTDEQGETMRDGLDPVKRSIGSAVLWDKKSACRSAYS